MKILSTFSLNMIWAQLEAHGQCAPIYTLVPDARIARDVLASAGYDPSESYVGHETTARLISAELRLDVPYNRVDCLLEEGETAMICQYVGPRLEAGATELPSGARIEYVLVEVPR